MTTVLVVDDEPAVRDVVVRYLAQAGYRALEAADGESARALLEQETPSLVILDLMLPGVDGLTLCREIRESSQLPVIMITALGEESDRLAGSRGRRRRLPHQAVLAARARRAGAGGAAARRAARARRRAARARRARDRRGPARGAQARRRRCA